jgi:glucan biosynthesis protein C
VNRFSGRVAGLDASRTTLMFFGLVVHSGALAAWLQTSTATPADDAANFLGILGHNFRMPAFFMVSGIFSAYLLNTRSLQRFWVQRRRRLVYPLLAASFTLIPVCYWILVGFEVSPEQIITMGPLHLWFIYYLIGFSLILLLVEWSLRKIGKSVVSSQVRPLGVWLVNPISIAAIALTSTLIPHWFDQSSGALANDSGLFPPIGLVAYYGLFFVYGLLLYRYWLSAEKWLRRFWPGHLLLGFAAFGVFAFELWNQTEHTWLYPSYSVATWMLSLGILGIFLFFVRKEGKVTRYLSDASYWVYLIHYPIMVMLQKWFADLHTGVALAFVLGVPIAAALSLGLYQRFVKDKFIGQFLAGKLASQTEAKKKRKS